MIAVQRPGERESSCTFNRRSDPFSFSLGNIQYIYAVRAVTSHSDNFFSSPNGEITAGDLKFKKTSFGLRHQEVPLSISRVFF